MQDPLVVLIYGHKSGYQTYLEQQLQHAGIERHDVVLSDFSWRRQLLATHAVASRFPDRLQLVIDAWDQVLLGTKEDLIEHAQSALLGHVTLAGAKNCWPDDRRADFLQRRGSEASPWQYINNSPLAGLGRDIAKAIEWGLLRFPMQTDSASVAEPSGDVPERFWTRLFLEGPADLGMRIDTQCELNQIHLGVVEGDLMIRHGRVFNNVTGTWPIFLHLNGGGRLPYGLA